MVWANDEIQTVQMIIGDKLHESLIFPKNLCIGRKSAVYFHIFADVNSHYRALGYFRLRALLECMSYKLAIHVLVAFVESCSNS